MKNFTPSLEHSGTPYVFSAQAKTPHPIVTIMGGNHGNEKAGIKLVKDLISYTHHHPIQQGTLHAIIGNIAAMKAGKRFIDQDLNRSFGSNNQILPPPYEAKRAAELKPFLQATDFLFDVHSTIKPSDPFIAVPNKNAFLENKKLLTKLGIETILTGEGLWPANHDPIYADTYVDTHGGLGVTIEAGWSDDPKTTQIIKGIHAALEYLGILDRKVTQGELHKPELIQFKVWHAIKNIIATSGFTFTKNGKPYEWANFEEVPSGAIYAIADNGQEFKAEEKFWMIFPKNQKNIVAGQEACILAQPL